MRVVLLAATGGFPHLGRTPPRAFVPWENGQPVLSVLLDSICYLGILPSDITVVLGSESSRLDSPPQSVKFLAPYNTILNPRSSATGSAFSLFLALSQRGEGEDTVLLNGDLVANVSRLQRALAGIGEDAVYGRSPFWVAEKGIPLAFDVPSRKITQVGLGARSDWPWSLYAGIACVRKSTAEAIVKNWTAESEGLNAVELIFQTQPILKYVSLDESDLLPLEGLDVDRELVGGSFANLERRHVVRKSAQGEGVGKLRQEIAWLQNLDERVGKFFPAVVRHHESTDETSFEMPWYPLPSLRRQLMLGRLLPEEGAVRLGSIIDFLETEIYPKNLRIIDSHEGEKWLRRHHLDRFVERFDVLRRTSPRLATVIDKKIFDINGVRYDGIHDSLSRVFDNAEWLKRLIPRRLGFVHGDLHFQNILVGESASDFILADPRGETAFDYHYDLGKLWHSFSGLYDFIHVERFTVKNLEIAENSVRVEFSLAEPGILGRYREVGSLVAGLVEGSNLLSSEENWLERTLFNEAMHFLTLPIFHIKNDPTEDRAMILFLRGVELLNQFVARFQR